MAAFRKQPANWSIARMGDQLCRQVYTRARDQDGILANWVRSPPAWNHG
jgi:hypothetical protein